MLASHDAQQLSFFELNLETWRQLWRVVEMSDILLIITDIRHPVSFTLCVCVRACVCAHSPFSFSAKQQQLCSFPLVLNAQAITKDHLRAVLL